MKAALISGIVLIAIIVCSAVSSIYIYNGADELYSKIDTISIDEGERLKQAYEEYTKFEPLASLIVNLERLSSLDQAFAELIGAAEANDTEQFIISKSCLLNAIKHLRQLNEFSIYNIL